jgi:hypothetical protein
MEDAKNKLLRYLVPPRTRAATVRAMGARCNPGSRCQLLARALIERIERALTKKKSSEDEDDERNEFSFSSSTSSSVSTAAWALMGHRPARSRLSDAEAKACLRMLDTEQMMREHLTRALAVATVQEALIQAQYDRVASHERDLMDSVVIELEFLEARLYSGAFARCSDAAAGEDAQRALLVHLGRGIELLQFNNATQRAA